MQGEPPAYIIKLWAPPRSSETCWDLRPLRREKVHVLRPRGSPGQMVPDWMAVGSRGTSRLAFSDLHLLFHRMFMPEFKEVKCAETAPLLYSPHFVEGDTEAQRRQGTCQGLQVLEAGTRAQCSAAGLGNREGDVPKLPPPLWGLPLFKPTQTHKLIKPQRSYWATPTPSIPISG